MEKRVPVAIVVHLAHVEDHTTEGPELTYTDNISAHGACVISARPWKAGEMAQVTSLNDRISLLGRVTYCRRGDKGRYDIGLNFQDREVTWNSCVRYASQKSGTLPGSVPVKLVRSI